MYWATCLWLLMQPFQCSTPLIEGKRHGRARITKQLPELTPQRAIARHRDCPPAGKKSGPRGGEHVPHSAVARRHAITACNASPRSENRAALCYTPHPRMRGKWALRCGQTNITWSRKRGCSLGVNKRASVALMEREGGRKGHHAGEKCRGGGGNSLWKTVRPAAAAEVTRSTHTPRKEDSSPSVLRGCRRSGGPAGHPR